MAKIRIAQRGWHGARAAETLDEVQTGIFCSWVEIDGHRITDVVSATFRAGPDFAVPKIEVEVIGPVEIVYLDKDGNELHGGPVETAEPGEHFAYETARERKTKNGAGHVAAYHDGDDQPDR